MKSLEKMGRQNAHYIDVQKEKETQKARKSVRAVNSTRSQKYARPTGPRWHGI